MGYGEYGQQEIFLGYKEQPIEDWIHDMNAQWTYDRTETSFIERNYHKFMDFVQEKLPEDYKLCVPCLKMGITYGIGILKRNSEALATSLAVAAAATVFFYPLALTN